MNMNKQKVPKPTYQLCLNSSDSSDFYRTSREVAGQTADICKHELEEFVKEYANYIDDKKLEKLRRPVEYELELLTLGVYFQVYESCAKKAGSNYQKLLRWTNSKRSKRNRFHSFYSHLKGWLTLGLLRDPDITRREKDSKKDSRRSEFMWKGFLNWMVSTGEFAEECIRFKQWKGFLMCLSKRRQMELFYAILLVTKRFLTLAEPRLRCFMGNTEQFIEEATKTYQGREDYLFVLRAPEEYYLNMVGAQLLNRAYREDFQAAALHVVFLPGCMVAKKQGGCQAKETALGNQCQQCTRDCPVRIITKFAKDYGTETRILYHNSDLMQTGDQTIGVVGVACVLNLISGGLKAKRLGMEAQCVLLDYCGCAAHWTKEGLITQLSLKELARVLS